MPKRKALSTDGSMEMTKEKIPEINEPLPDSSLNVGEGEEYKDLLKEVTPETIQEPQKKKRRRRKKSEPEDDLLSGLQVGELAFMPLDFVCSNLADSLKDQAFRITTEQKEQWVKYANAVGDQYLPDWLEKHGALIGLCVSSALIFVPRYMLYNKLTQKKNPVESIQKPEEIKHVSESTL